MYLAFSAALILVDVRHDVFNGQQGAFQFDVVRIALGRLFQQICKQDHGNKKNTQMLNGFVLELGLLEDNLDCGVFKKCMQLNANVIRCR